MKKWISKLAGRVVNVDPSGVADAFDKIAVAADRFKFTGDNEAQFKHDQAQLLAVVDQAQIALNASGNSPSWRDSIGRACSVSFWIMFAINPAVLLAVAIVGEMTPLDFEIEHWKDIINTIYDPQIIGGFMPVVAGMLGLGAMRSYDKKNAPVQGARRKNIRAFVKARMKLAKKGVPDEEAEELIEELMDAA